MIKIAYVCNNYGDIKDGIGVYAKKICEEFQKDSDYELSVFTSSTLELSFIKKFLSLKMTKEMLKIKSKYKKEKYDYILIEYPFVEYNPLILVALKKIRHSIGKNTKIILSLHEYGRVKKLRKWIIRKLVKNSDIVYITLEDDLKYLRSKFKKVQFKLRTIPSTICDDVVGPKRKNHYTFFGLVNKSKAFDEMIQGWKAFNNSRNNVLNIITSSDLDTNDFGADIKVYKSIPDHDVARLFNESQFCILPIIPEVSYNNGTLKACCLYSNIAIGKISELLNGKIEFINMCDYSIKSFIKAFEESAQFSNDKLNDFSNKNLTFGKLFSFSRTVEEYKESMKR